MMAEGSMKHRWIISSFLLALFAGTVSLALAQGQGKGKGHGPKNKETAVVEKSSTNIRVVFSSQDRSVVSGWFREHGASGLPPGLAKRDRLPPGLERQLRERGSLPPGLQKKLQPLPIELERRLPPLPVGYRRSVIGAHVVITNSSGTFVFDIVRNIVPY